MFFARTTRKDSLNSPAVVMRPVRHCLRLQALTGGGYPRQNLFLASVLIYPIYPEFTRRERSRRTKTPKRNLDFL